MTLKIIKTKKDYLLALKRFETIFQSKEGTKESDEVNVLALLIKEYEDVHYVIKNPSAIDAIKYRMEQQGLSNKDLAGILGSSSRVSEIFNKKRKLTLEMIRKLHLKLNIPLELLVYNYR